ncbi:hypothetical protein RRG08_045705 [Elysia crispata]|uniref:Uncharacterized protein n=1 Tax=Elysia crispata TaxID=231223 RepID=A0AAE0Z2A3_9GAST|nr:hypothetical protein RRG08_045705 [Elysia crispata]
MIPRGRNGLGSFPWNPEKSHTISRNLGASHESLIRIINHRRASQSQRRQDTVEQRQTFEGSQRVLKHRDARTLWNRLSRVLKESSSIETPGHCGTEADFRGFSKSSQV